MDYSNIAAQAASWALDKIGCRYSQADRTKDNIFDCSSLVARAYTAQGKKWLYGGRIPSSMHEVYDDDFELLWPDTYLMIGKMLGSNAVIKMATTPGDIQYLCTDADTRRINKITHVAMVIPDSKIVHARNEKQGVCTNSIDLYAGKVCAVTRYNPSCSLRLGMKGYRTIALQEALNKNGAHLNIDGEFGPLTEAAVKHYQNQQSLVATGEADLQTLSSLCLV